MCMRTENNSGSKEVRHEQGHAGLGLCRLPHRTPALPGIRLRRLPWLTCLAPKQGPMGDSRLEKQHAFLPVMACRWPSSSGLIGRIKCSVSSL